MGAGKSSIGRQLAKSLKKTFHDSDKELEERTGVDIPTIFEYEGEEGFRKREAAIIDELTSMTGIVLATGGGAVLREENRRCLRSRGTVIYLTAPLDTLVKRAGHDNNRPLLNGCDTRLTLEKLIADRDPLYLEVADITVNTAGGSVAAIVKQIVTLLDNQEQRT